VCGVSTINLGVVWCGACNESRIWMCETKFVRSRYWCATQKLCALDICV
jgi:hypothetical protein